MHAKQLPLMVRIQMVETNLNHLNRSKANIETRIKLVERGIAEMMESPEKLDRQQFLEYLEESHNNIKEKINALENWLVDVGAPGWGTKL